MAKILIYSEAVHTGKTTRLAQYFEHQTDVFGFLNPDIQGIRHLLNLHTKELMRLDLPEDTDLPFIEVGKYRLSAPALEAARNILTQMNSVSKSYFVIDEIGKIEMENRGMEPELSACIIQFKQRIDDATLIVVIRDYLLDVAIKKYALEGAEVVGHTYFENV